MKRTLCSKCHERPAVIFIQRIENGKTTPEGLCIRCAMEMNIGPIKQMMENMGITEDDLDTIDEQMTAAFDGIDALFNGKNASASLLQGVTGSGKTAVYVHLIDAMRRRGRSSILLVPELLKEFSCLILLT